MNNGTASTGSVLTKDMLLDCLNLLPKPVGYALLSGSKHTDGKAYKLRNDLKIGDHLYMLVVPQHFLPTAAASLNARPSDDFPGSYRFDVWKDEPELYQQEKHP